VDQSFAEGSLISWRLLVIDVINEWFFMEKRVTSATVSPSQAFLNAAFEPDNCVEAAHDQSLRRTGPWVWLNEQKGVVELLLALC
jgi:hypothetical protein